MTDNDLIFSDNSGHLVVVMNQVVQRLLAYRQLHPHSKEAGGVLIGERRGHHLVICDLSEPGCGDHRSRFRVNRKGAHHQAKVNKAFKESNGTRQYMGEWHSHPEDIPAPSFIDKHSWKKNIAASAPMVILIVGRRRVWVGKKEGNVITSLTQVD